MSKREKNVELAREKSVELARDFIILVDFTVVKKLVSSQNVELARVVEISRVELARGCFTNNRKKGKKKK